MLIEVERVERLAALCEQAREGADAVSETIVGLLNQAILSEERFRAFLRNLLPPPSDAARLELQQLGLLDMEPR